MHNQHHEGGQFGQADLLNILCRTPADCVKQFAEQLIPALGNIEVVYNRTGLTMLPMRDPVQGTTFYLGEVLISEAYVRLHLDGAEQSPLAEGYAACLGRDLQQALALALIDAAHAAGLAQERVTQFVTEQAAHLEAAEQELLRQVAATRVDMETF